MILICHFLFLPLDGRNRNIFLTINWSKRERERERDRERDRQTDRQTDRDRETGEPI